MMTTLLLIRHGQTDWNLDGRYTGQSDIPLNSTGREQARQAAERLGDWVPEAVYSSDLWRARETAEIIARRYGLSVLVDARLREINQGVWEGMHFDEIRRRYAQELARREADPLNVAPPGGETVGQVRERVLGAVSDIARCHPAGTVVLVSHALALALVKAYYSRHSVEEVWDLIPPNAAVEIVDTSIPNIGGTTGD